MKKIKFLMMAAVALVTAMSFTACSDDDDNSSNYQKYQQEVDATVRTQKKHDNALLLVAFGSTWQQAFDTFDTILKEYKEEFGDEWDVYLAFSSAICINNARVGENAKDPDYPAEIRSYYDPEHWLTAFGRNNYKKIVVQSLQVIPGEEFRRVRDSYVKDFMNNRNGDFTEEYMHSIDKQVAVGMPLMGSDDDVTELANILVNESDVKTMIDNGTVVAFMGHGNPEDYDYYGANIRYTELENALQALKPKMFYVGTVDMPGNFVNDMHGRMEDNGISSGSVQFYPLMSIAGDHAHNDMADEDDPESWYSLFNEWGYEASAYETIYPKSAACYTKYVAGTDYIPALGERKKVRELWMQHTQDAIDAINNGEGLSTPTTEVEEEE